MSNANTNKFFTKCDIFKFIWFWLPHFPFSNYVWKSTGFSMIRKVDITSELQCMSEIDLNAPNLLFLIKAVIVYLIIKHFVKFYVLYSLILPITAYNE